MYQKAYAMKYPRRVFIRKLMISAGKLLLKLLADVEIHGKENLPKSGPMILAGNHVAALEAVMMAVYSPSLVEFFGNGDIPFDPNYAFIVNAYGLIPINRGNLDRQNLLAAIDILKQGGVLGIFPEGGIWDPTQMQAQTGIALISYRAQSPVIPIGFGGVRNGLTDVLNLKHPKLVMSIGEKIPPVRIDDSSLSLRQNLETSANTILNEIKALIPENDLRSHSHRVEESFTLIVKVFSNNVLVSLPQDLKIIHGDSYARLVFNPVILDVLVRNLRLPIKPLRIIDDQSDLIQVINAFDSILNYLQENPGFFTYRFGMDEGLALKSALHELRLLSIWAHENDHKISLKPIHRYRNAKTNACVEESGGIFPNSMKPL